MAPQFLILAMYLTIRRKRKNCCLGISLVVWGLQWGPLVLQVREIALLDPAKVGQDQRRVVGGDIEPSAPRTGHVFDI